MKLTISTSIISHLSTSLLQLGVSIQEELSTNVAYNTLKEILLSKEAENTNTDIEKLRVSNKKKQDKKVVKFLSSLNALTDIQEVSTKICTITKTEEEVVININDEFIKDSLDICFKIATKFIPVSVTSSTILPQFDDEINALESKWEEIDTTIESITINGWYFTIDKELKPEIRLINDKMTTVHTWIASNGLNATIAPYQLQRISNNALDTLNNRFSKDLLEAIVILSDKLYPKS